MNYSHGGKREGAGRKVGVPNKTTAEIRELAKELGPAAIKKLQDLMENTQDDKISLMACKELLDRGYGRSTASINHEERNYVLDHERAEAIRGRLIERIKELQESDTN